MAKDINEILKDKVHIRLEKNMEAMKPIVEGNADIIKRDFVFHGPADITGVIYYTDGLVNVQLIDDYILKPLMVYSSEMRQQGDDAVNHRRRSA